MKRTKLEVKSTHGGARITPKTNLYAYASKYGYEAIDNLLEIGRTAKQESVRMAAWGKLLDKILADLKASDVSVGGHFTISFHNSLKQIND